MKELKSDDHIVQIIAAAPGWRCKWNTEHGERERAIAAFALMRYGDVVPMFSDGYGKIQTNTFDEDTDPRILGPGEE